MAEPKVYIYDCPNQYVEDCDFQGETIEYADFSGSVFKEFANFSNCTFLCFADFTGAVFKEGAAFSNAKFGKQVQTEFDDKTIRFLKRGGPGAEKYYIQINKNEDGTLVAPVEMPGIDINASTDDLNKFGLKKYPQGIKSKIIENFNRIKLNPGYVSFAKCRFGSLDLNKAKVPPDKMALAINNARDSNRSALNKLVNSGKEPSSPEEELLFTELYIALSKSMESDEYNKLISSKTGYVYFTSTEFHNAGSVDFTSAIFLNTNDVTFNSAQFHNSSIVDFNSTRFHNEGDVKYNSVDFRNTGSVNFQRTIFHNADSVIFSSTIFQNSDDVYFGVVNFYNSGDAKFENARFKNHGNVTFRQTRFQNIGSVKFTRARFNNNGAVDFSSAIFLNLDMVMFNSIHFKNDGLVQFVSNQFYNAGPVSFSFDFLQKGSILFNSVVFANLSSDNIIAEEGSPSYPTSLVFYLNDIRPDLDIKFRECLFLNDETVSFKNCKFADKGKVRFSNCHFGPGLDDDVKVDFSGAEWNNAVFEGGEISWIKEIDDAKEHSTEYVTIDEILQKQDLEPPAKTKEWIDRLNESSDGGIYKIPVKTKVFDEKCVVSWERLLFDTAKNTLFSLVCLARSKFDGVTLKYVEIIAPTWLKKDGRNLLYAEELINKKLGKNKKEVSNTEIRGAIEQSEQLRSKLEAYGNFQSAGDFHYGAQELKRKLEDEYRWSEIVLRVFHSFGSGHSERPGWAFGALITLVMICTLLSFGWQNWHNVNMTVTAIERIHCPEQEDNSEACRSSDLGFIKTMFHVISPFWQKARLDKINSENDWYYLLLFFANLIIYIQVVMLILAVRRRFKR